MNAHTGRRSGFTLVELLVSVAVVVIMMSLFATVFQICTAAMTKAKGNASNDQKSRLLVTVLNADIAKRTFRIVLPFTAANVQKFPTKRDGYFTVSENDPNDDADDVLAFTVAMFNTLKDHETRPMYGKSVQLIGDSYDQPEFDDGDASANDSAGSQMAEVVYFLRAGNLYRRVMLSRQPYATDLRRHPQAIQPQRIGADGKTTDFFDAVPPYNVYSKSLTIGGSDVFYRDFDFSAWNNGARRKASVLKFATISDLQFPFNRFGFNPFDSGAEAGTPREYVAGGKFIGRFTQAETSADGFGYPGRMDDPTPLNDPALTLGADGQVTQFASGPRRGEDLVLTNVHAFDVKLWDEGVGEFRDVGYAGPSNSPGVLCRTKCLNRLHGPRVPDNGADGQPGVAGADDDGDGTADNIGEQGWPGSDDAATRGVFDTWVEVYPVDLDGDGAGDAAPYAPAEAVRAMQVIVRYLDTTSGQMRDLTIMQSMDE